MPYVIGHGRWPHGTDWLTEAALGTYIPLLNALNDLVEEGISPKITIGITPILAEQLADDAFVHEFISYMQAKIEAVEADEKFFGAMGDEHLATLARRWNAHYTHIFGCFRRRYNRSIINAFKKLQDDGHIEIITSGATHGYFPLLSRDTSIQAQVKQGVATYKRHFGRDPKGFWLPECAYRPRYAWSYPVKPSNGTGEPYLRKGVEEFLGENGIDYFMIENHLLKGGTALGVYADRFGALKKLWTEFEKHYIPTDGAKTEHRAYWVRSYGEAAEPVCIFPRDGRTGGQVWSATGGYPGDEWYLEFHKKHNPGGNTYWRVTGEDVDLGDKLPYVPEKAVEMVKSHAAHYVSVVKEVMQAHIDQYGEPGVVCAPYDTELYGHWWFEGVEWIKQVIALMSRDPEINICTGSDYLNANPPKQAVALPEGSWGEGGFHWIWLNKDTRWTWELVYDAEKDLVDLATELEGNQNAERMVKQAARELFLMQSSDWQFNISTGGSVDYGAMRLKAHYANLKRLCELARKAASGENLTIEDWDFIDYCEERNQVFQDIDPSWFVRLEHEPNLG